MTRLAFVATVSFFLVGTAVANKQRRAAPAGPAPGPFGPAFEKLSPNQKESLKKIFEDQALTKGQLKQKIEEFAKGLPADVQVCSLDSLSGDFQ